MGRGCDCGWCSSNRTIGVRKQLLPEGCQTAKRKSYPTKSNKIILDRFYAARKNLKMVINWFYDAVKRGDKSGGFWRKEISRNDYWVKKYRKTRTECKRLNLL